MLESDGKLALPKSTLITLTHIAAFGKENFEKIGVFLAFFAFSRLQHIDGQLYKIVVIALRRKVI